MMKKVIMVVLGFLLTVFLAGSAQSQLISGYYDTSRGTILTLEKSLDVEYFNIGGYTDFYGEDFDFSSYFLEYRMTSGELIYGFKVQAEYNDGSVLEDNLVRFGLVKSYKGVTLRVFPKDFGRDSFHASALFSFNLPYDLTFTGWVDRDFLKGIDDTFVAEGELCYNLYRKINAVAEVRFSDYLVQDELSVAFGVRLQ